MSQVLKGPQGTLVGRNTTGGAILYNSREPGPDFGGYVQATVGDYARAGLQGAVNMPLADTLFLRVALNSENQKGYIANHFFDPASAAPQQPGRDGLQEAGRHLLAEMAAGRQLQPGAARRHLVRA